MELIQDWLLIPFTVDDADSAYICLDILPDIKVHGANMGPIWGQQDPGGPHIGPMNLAIWAGIIIKFILILSILICFAFTVWYIIIVYIAQLF